MAAQVLTLKQPDQDKNIAWSWRYKQLLEILPDGENCTAKAFAMAYVEHDCDLIETTPEPKYHSWELSSYDQEVQALIQQFREQKNKLPNSVRELLNDDLHCAQISMTEDQAEEYQGLRNEVLSHYAGSNLSEQSLMLIDTLISLARLSHQRRAELLTFRCNETNSQTIKQHRQSVSYFNREIAVLIRQIKAIQKSDSIKSNLNKVRLL